MTQPAHFRRVYPICELSLGPHSPTEERRTQGMFEPNCDASGAFLQHVGAHWTDWNLFSQSKFPLPFVHLCHFIIFEMCGFCLCSPKRQMLRHGSGNALLPGGWDGIKLLKGWRTQIFLLTGPLPPATSPYSKKLQICALSQSFELTTHSAL